MSDGAYSFSLTTFNRNGKLLQIEYALVAAQQKLSIGICATNGVVLVTDKKLPSTLIDETQYQKIENITPAAGFTFSGMASDYRVLLRKARKSAQRYYLTYREQQPVNQLVKDSASVMQEYTQSGGVRPFGLSLLVAGYDDNGPQLFQVDPSGISLQWKATAIGKKFQDAKNFLEKRYSDEMELDDAVHNALLIMRENFEGEMNEFNIEVAVVGPDRVFRILKPSEVKDYLDEQI